MVPGKCQINATNYDDDDYYPEVVSFLTDSPEPAEGLDPACRYVPRLEGSLPEGSHHRSEARGQG